MYKCCRNVNMFHEKSAFPPRFAWYGIIFFSLAGACPADTPPPESPRPSRAVPPWGTGNPVAPCGFPDHRPAYRCPLFSINSSLFQSSFSKECPLNVVSLRRRSPKTPPPPSPPLTADSRPSPASKEGRVFDSPPGVTRPPPNTREGPRTSLLLLLRKFPIFPPTVKI